MGRGAYDTTNPSLAKSSAAMEALRLNNIERAEQAKMDAEFQAAEDYAKLVKSKKSRGIVAARKAAKEQAARAQEAAAAYESEGESDAMAKP